MDDTNNFERFFDYFNIKLFALGACECETAT